MRRDERRKNGIALITMLMLLCLCLLLVAAFFQVEMGTRSLFEGSRKQAGREQSLDTLFEFCRYQIEKDRTWGIPADSSANFEWPGTISWDELPSTGPEGLFEGTLTPSGHKFSVRVLNNLDSNEVGPEGLPGRMVRLRLSVEDSKGKSEVEIHLHKAPLYDSSFVASRIIDVDADKMSLDSVDPIYNQMRSLEGTTLPELSPSDPSLVFRSDEGDGDAPNAVKGTVWSKSSITVPGVTLEQAEEITGGQFIEFAKDDYEPVEIGFDDLELTENISRFATLPGGEYTFRTVFADYLKDGAWTALTDDSGDDIRLHVLQYKTAPGESVSDFHYDRSVLPSDLDPDRLAIRGEPGSTGVPEPDNRFHLEDGLIINLKRARMVVAPATQVEFMGDTRVEGHVGVRPTVEIMGTWTDLDAGVIKVHGGLRLGQLLGSGSVVVEDVLRLEPLDLSVSDDVDVALFAGGNIFIKVTDSFGPDPRALLRGLVYSGADIVYVGRDGSFELEGAMVAPRGSILVGEVQDCRVIYNPEYLDLVLKKPEDSTVEVDTVSWREL